MFNVFAQMEYQFYGPRKIEWKFWALYLGLGICTVFLVVVALAIAI